jgi:hypothetical protein
MNKKQAQKATEIGKSRNYRQTIFMSSRTLLRASFRGTSRHVVERKGRMKLCRDKLITVWLSEAFIVSCEWNLALISRALPDGVICRLFELSGEMGTGGPEMMLSEAARLMETIDDESEAD